MGIARDSAQRIGNVWGVSVLLLHLALPSYALAQVESGHGFLRQDPIHPHWLSFTDGTYPYLVGTTNYDLMGTPDQNIAETIDWQAQYFNVMRVSLRPKRDLWNTYGKTPGMNMNTANPFGGTWDAPLPGINEAYWTRFAAMIQRAAAQGIIIELILCRDGHKEYNPLLDGATFARFIQETSSHWNLIYNIANEYEENITADEVRSLASRIKQADPNQHPVSVHMLDSGAYDFWTEPWSDFAAYQYITVPEDQNSLFRSNWSRNEPQINEEYGYEGRITAGEVVLRHWAMLAGGGMGFYGHSPDRLEGWYMIGKGWGDPGVAHGYLAHMLGFMNSRVAFWRMEPDNARLVSGAGWVLSEPGREYLVVLPQGGGYTLDLAGAASSLPVERLDPMTGTITPLGSTGGASTHSGTASGFSIIHVGSRGASDDATPPAPPSDLRAQ